MPDIAFARAVHILAVVAWIGGVSMVTTVILPAVRRGDFGLDRLRAFEAVEGRFVWVARIAVTVVGLSGLYMVTRLDAWTWFQSLSFWWMHAMVCLWLLFAAILFIIEPLVLRRRFRGWAASDPEAAFARLYRAHWFLLTLSLITILGAVAGSHGWSIF